MGFILDFIDKDLRERGIGHVVHSEKKVIKTAAQAKYDDIRAVERNYTHGGRKKKGSQA